MSDRPVTRTEGEVLELLQALIRNRCVNDGSPASGHEARSVATLEAYFGASGEVVEPAPDRQSVVYRIPGSDPAAPCLLLMGHLDVVPVTEEGWSVDPFGAEVIDGMVWGRGAVDMLNLTAAMAVVFKPYLTGESPPPPGDLVYLAVADEEEGGGLGAGWLMDHRPELIECDYVLTEVASPAIYDHIFRSEALRLSTALGLLIFVVFACHRWLPGRRRPLARIWPGIILTLGLWLLAARLFSSYLSSVAIYSLTYAGLAGVMTALIFLYLMAVILILGAEYNSAREKPQLDRP